MNTLAWISDTTISPWHSLRIPLAFIRSTGRWFSSPATPVGFESWERTANRPKEHGSNRMATFPPAQFAKSDKDGNCTVRNMPEGVSRLHVYYGDESAGPKVVVSASSANEAPVTIRLTKISDVAQQGSPKERLGRRQ